MTSTTTNSVDGNNLHTVTCSKTDINTSAGVCKVFRSIQSIVNLVETSFIDSSIRSNGSVGREIIVRSIVCKDSSSTSSVLSNLIGFKNSILVFSEHLTFVLHVHIVKHDSKHILHTGITNGTSNGRELRTTTTSSNHLRQCRRTNNLYVVCGSSSNCGCSSICVRHINSTGSGENTFDFSSISVLGNGSNKECNVLRVIKTSNSSFVSSGGNKLSQLLSLSLSSKQCVFGKRTSKNSACRGLTGSILSLHEVNVILLNRLRSIRRNSPGNIGTTTRFEATF